MYYVATPERPYPNDKLHHGKRFVPVAEWAQREAESRGAALDVRDTRTGRISASYDAYGRNIPIREP